MNSRPPLGRPSRGRERRGLIGERRRVLVGLACLLIVAPIDVAGWGLWRDNTNADSSRTHSAVEASLRAARLDLLTKQAEAQTRAVRIAASRPVQAAVAAHNIPRLERHASKTVSFLVRGRVVGPPPSPLRGQAEITGTAANRLATVVVSVRLSPRAIRRLERRALAAPADRILVENLALVGPSAIRRLGRGAVTASQNIPGTPLELVVLAPQPRSVHRGLWWLVAALVVTDVTVVAGVVAASKAMASPSGGDRERRRARGLAALIGDALSSTHDRQRLLEVIVSAAVQATGAAGAQIFENDEQVVATGRVGALPAVELQLAGPPSAQTTLVLHPPSEGLEPAALALASAIAAQARVALENVDLHQLAEAQAFTDDLTGLANRRHFTRRLDIDLSRANAAGERLAVVFADLDRFKAINDRYGHAAGDDVLRTFAEILREHSRDVDLPARIGGEEFAVLLPHTDLDGAAAFAERLRVALEATAPMGAAHRSRVTASFGVAGSQPGRDGEWILRAADAALYRAKQRGRNSVVTAHARRPAV